MKRERRGTQTAAFGSPGRVNHDSTPFYSRRLYEGLPGERRVEYVEHPIPPECLNRIFCKSSEAMSEIPDCSVHLVVTSPPYNVGKEYDEHRTLGEYREFLKKVWSEVKRVLVPGGRACINVANLGRRPYIPLHVYIVEDMLSLGFLMRGEVIWNKTGGGSPSTAWGTWRSAQNPTLRDRHEYILIFSKDTFERQNPRRRRSTISREEFLGFTQSVWTFPPESAAKVGHPAPFPVELPYRLIQLYTFAGEVVLDPFMGSGQTAVAAVLTEREFIGYEIVPQYVELAQRRVQVVRCLLDWVGRDCELAERKSRVLRRLSELNGKMPLLSASSMGGGPWAAVVRVSDAEVPGGLRREGMTDLSVLPSDEGGIGESGRRPR